MAEAVTVTLGKARETKNTWRFEASGDDAPIDVLYVRKATLAELGDPAAITLTVQPA